MSKYSPLEQFLSQSTESEIKLSFSEIEGILEKPLPASARTHAAWWSNNATGHVNAAAWLSAGYKARKVNLEQEQLVFVKDAGLAPKPAGNKPKQHPIFGCMKGLITIPDDLDLTEPADPDWGEIAYGKDI